MRHVKIYRTLNKNSLLQTYKKIIGLYTSLIKKLSSQSNLYMRTTCHTHLFVNYANPALKDKVQKSDRQLSVDVN